MATFLGEANASMDDKNRLTLPKKFRDRLNSDHEETFRVYILPGYDGADFSIMDRKGGEAWLAQFDNIGFGPGRAANARRLLHASSECSVDRAGRMLVPATLLERRGIKGRDFIVAGAGTYLEVFSRERWEEHQARLNGESVDAMLDELNQAVVAKEQNDTRASAGDVTTATSAG